MPGAGFYAVESGPISFRRDGNWYTGEERIDNPRIALLFSRCLRRDSAGNYFLQVGDEHAPVNVEDTPWVVVAIDALPGGDFRIRLNDGDSEPLDCASLEVGAGNVMYCAAKSERYRTRILRPAYYHLAPFFESGEAGEYFLRAHGRRYPIGLVSGS